MHILSKSFRSANLAYQEIGQNRSPTWTTKFIVKDKLFEFLIVHSSIIDSFLILSGIGYKALTSFFNWDYLSIITLSIVLVPFFTLFAFIGLIEVNYRLYYSLKVIISHALSILNSLLRKPTENSSNFEAKGFTIVFYHWLFLYLYYW